MREEGFTDISIEEFSYICRTCCLKNEGLMSLEETKYFDLFKTITDIQIEADDELPNKICHKCINKLEEVSSFITISKNNDIHLKEILQRSKAKLLDDSDVTNLSCDVKDDPEDSDASEELCGKAKTKQEHEPKTGKTTRKSKKSNKDDKRIKCVACGLHFLTKKQLSEHQKNNACRERDFKCSDCDKAFHTKFRLNLHKRSHTKATPYECKICLKKFRHAPNLKRHDDIIHKGLKPFKCEVCGKEFATYLRQTEHLRIHTGERPHICSYCGMGFKKYSTRYAHEMRHKIKNGELPKSDKQPKKYYRKPPKDPTELQCDTCKKTLSSKQALLVHKQIHLGDKPFLCTICGKGFIRKSHLDVHLRIHTGERPYECSDCGKRFRQAACFRNHLLIHKGERSFKCEICQRSFVQIGHLQSHLKTHTGERPYICTFCGKGFAQNGNLKAHTRIHTGERPYRCDVCYLGFYDSASLRKHVKSHESREIKVEVGSVDHHQAIHSS